MGTFFALQDAIRLGRAIGIALSRAEIALNLLGDGVPGFCHLGMVVARPFAHPGNLDRITGLASGRFVKLSGLVIDGTLTPGKASPNVDSFNATSKHRQRPRRTRRGSYPRGPSRRPVAV